MASSASGTSTGSQKYQWPPSECFIDPSEFWTPGVLTRADYEHAVQILRDQGVITRATSYETFYRAKAAQ